MKAFAAFLFVVLAGAVFGQKKITMTVKENSVPCRRMMEQVCLQVMKEGSKEWELFYDRIQGFDYEQGYRYEIVIIETPRPEPVPQDLSRNTYSLDKIISKTAVGSSTGESMRTGMTNLEVLELNGLALNTDDLFFSFSEDGKSIVGKSGCNSFNLPIEWNSKKTKIKTGSGMHTMMACADPAKQQLETNFLAAVTNKKFKVQHKNGRIIWKKGMKQILVLDTLVPMPQAAEKPMRTGWDYFRGKSLRVIQLNGTNYTTDAKLTFLDNSFAGSDGCNQVSGSLKTDGHSISFGQVVSTKMMCQGPPAEIERQILAILNSSGLTMDFAERVLNIYDSKGKLVMMLAAVD